jgi:hypothetical protein
MNNQIVNFSSNGGDRAGNAWNEAKKKKLFL